MKDRPFGTRPGWRFPPGATVAPGGVNFLAHRIQAAAPESHGEPLLPRPVRARPRPSDVAWHGARLGAPGWSDPGGRLLAFTIAGTGDEEDLHVILNMAETAIDVEIPSIAGCRWHVAVDTVRETPLDVVEPARQVPWAAPYYRTSTRSVVVLEAR